MGGVIQSTTKTTTNKDGLQVEQELEKIIRYPKTQEFVMSFVKDLSYMKNLTKGEMLCMFGLLQIVSINNEVILNGTIKDRISKEYEFKGRSIDSYLQGLRKKSIIERIGRGTFILNPYLFGKGQWSDIKKLRMYIEWDFKTKTKKQVLEFDYLNEKEKLDVETTQMEQLQNEWKILKSQTKDVEQEINLLNYQDQGA